MSHINLPHQPESVYTMQSRCIAFFRRYATIARAPLFGKIFLAIGAVTLLVTTIWWSWLGAKLQSGNADQAITAFLFPSPASLPQDYLPSAHSFMLKWPFFWLAAVFQNQSAGLVTATISVVVLTVLGLMFVMWRIERRPLVLGCWFAAFASVLLLVPPLPAPGNLLPVNMAMLSTRNIEYIVLILALWLIIRYTRLRDWRLWLGIMLLGILVATDKLFVPLVLGGASAAFAVYAATKNRQLISMSARWLFGSAVAIAIGIGLLALVGGRVVHIQNDGVLTPYDLTGSLHQLAIAIMYGIVAVATNAGMLPAPTNTVLTGVPAQLFRHLTGGFRVAIIVNTVFLITGLVCAALIIGNSIRQKNQSNVLLGSHRLVLAITWSALAAIAAFVLTAHYYAGDARYLTIVMIALLLAAVYELSGKKLPHAAVAGVGLVTLVGIILAIGPTHAGYRTDRQALAGVEKRNQTVASVLHKHGINVLVGDYWRVVPTKLKYAPGLHIVPLQTCSEQRAVLTRSEWRRDVSSARFAYLLSFDKSLTDFPQCSLQEIIRAYGKPDASVVIVGSIAHPVESVLFYDYEPEYDRVAAQN